MADSFFHWVKSFSSTEKTFVLDFGSRKAVNWWKFVKKKKKKGLARNSTSKSGKALSRASSFPLFRAQRAFYTQERRLVFSIFEALISIFLPINGFCVANEVCSTVVISFFSSLLTKCIQRWPFRVAQQKFSFPKPVDVDCGQNIFGHNSSNKSWASDRF